MRTTVSRLISRATLFLALAVEAISAQAQVAPKVVGNVSPPEWIDTAPISTTFVEVEKGVRLEVLDWGGSGRPLVLLAGLGNTAHVFDSFAPRLTTKYHVLGITRRGYGASSVPASGYSAERLGKDVLSVIDTLHLTHAVVMGHSIAGEELSFLGSEPGHVAGLVYLDAVYPYAYQNPKTRSLKAEIDGLGSRVFEFAFTPPTPADTANFAAMQAWSLAGRGVLIPEADFHETFLRDPKGGITGPRAPDRVPEAILAGEQTFNRIVVPILALCSVPHSYGQSFGSKNPAGAAKFTADEEALMTEQRDAFASGNPAAHVVTLPRSNHYIFLSNPDDVVRETDSFVDKLGR